MVLNSNDINCETVLCKKQNARDVAQVTNQYTSKGHPLGFHSHINLQPKTGCPLKLSRVEPGQYLDGRPPGKTRLLLEEVLVRPAVSAHAVVCVGPNAPV